MVEHIAQADSLPIALAHNDGLRILEAVEKEGLLSISLWGQGSARLRVSPDALDWPSSVIAVRDQVTGEHLFEGTAADLAAGFEVRIAHENQPLALVVGDPDRVQEFTGIYDSAEVFQGLTVSSAVENPEVPIAAPAGDGPRIGIYHRSRNASGLLEFLRDQHGLHAFQLPRLSADDRP